MADIAALRIGEVDVPVRVIRSARRRRTVSFAVEAGCVVVRAPLRMAARDIEAMLRARHGWIARRLAVAPMRPDVYAHGERVRYLGDQVLICVREGLRRTTKIEVEGDVLTVEATAGASSEAVAAAIIRWFRARAVEHLSEAVSRWGEAAGAQPAKLIVKEQRRRWGSCGADGVIRLNWRLITLAPEVADYVVVHELAHLKEQNHGPRFWAEVERVMPDFRARRAKLSAAGA
jgi:predicted metal-dependent hydrolase